MIHIDIGITQSQILPVTVNELLPCGNTCSVAVFKIVNQFSKKEKLFIPNDDLSSWQERINLFEVYVTDIPANENLTSGILYFTQSDVGMWRYTIYHQECTVPGIDPDQFVKELETGYLKIII